MDCRRAEKIFVESGRTDTLSGHLSQCARCQEKLGAYDALVSSLAVETPLDPAAEDRILRRVLSTDVEEATPPKKRLPLWSLGLAGAAALLLLVILLPRPVARTVRVIERTGALAVGDIEVLDEVTVPPKSRMTVDFDRGLVVAFGPKTRAQVPRVESGQLLLPLTSGVLHVRYDRSPGDPPLRVKSPFGRVTVVGTIFTVSQLGDRFEVRVDEGVVEVEGEGGVRTLAAGESIGDPAPAPRLPRSGARLGRLMLSGDAQDVRIEGRPIDLPAALALEPGQAKIEVGGEAREVLIDAGQTVRLVLERTDPAPEPEPEPELQREPEPEPEPEHESEPDRTRPKEPEPRAKPSLETLYGQAEEALARKNTSQALQLLRAISRRDPRGPTGALAEFEIGRIHAERLRHEQARAAWARSLEAGLTEPLASEAQLGICAAQLALGRVRDARTCVRKLEGAPAVATRAAVIEGQLSCLEGRFDRAEEVLSRLKARPKSDLAGQIVIARIRCDLARGNREAAERKLSKMEANFGGPAWSRQIENLRRAVDPRNSRKR